MVNTIACYIDNLYLLANITDPGGQIEWLRETLSLAEADGELVYIVAHIPIAYEDCFSAWSARYNALIDRYQNIVKG